MHHMFPHMYIYAAYSIHRHITQSLSACSLPVHVTVSPHSQCSVTKLLQGQLRSHVRWDSTMGTQ